MDRSPGTLLAVLAHPDDETFGMGGTLALYAQKGYAVHLVCATRGEAGTVDPEFLGPGRTIAELREGELRCASENLGLASVNFLGYRDSGMPGSPDNSHPDAQIIHSVDEVAGRIVKYIRELKPEVVLTFDPIGGYMHPDHIHVHKATVLAFERAGDATFHPEAGAPFQPRALYFQVFSRGLFRLATRLMPVFGIDPRRFGRNKDIDLLALTEHNFPVHARIDIRPVSEIKAAATRCHASQTGGMQSSRGAGIVNLLWRGRDQSERYMRLYPPTNGNHRVARDLFEGI